MFKKLRETSPRLALEPYAAFPTKRYCGICLILQLKRSKILNIGYNTC